MNSRIAYSSLLLSIAVCTQFTACAQDAPEEISIIPQPLSMTVRTGTFTMNELTSISWDRAMPELREQAEYLGSILQRSTGYAFAARSGENRAVRNSIAFTHGADSALGDEGYELESTQAGISIKANDSRGAFYAVQTLLQLLPPDVYSNGKTSRVWNVPCLYVRDAPRFSWRGMHLDVSRHFFPKEFVKTYIDMIALHKMNVFHWHLTDDQGWRIEIKKHPKLTQTGAWRVDRESVDWSNRYPQQPDEKATYGGYYTQDDVREIVEYARSRFITVVPEIEMPAHTIAALAAYPEFSCAGTPLTVPPGSVWPDTDIYCAGKDETFGFLEDVLTEVMALFPGEYIHVGGDEADKTQWRKCPRCQARMRSEGLKNEDELQSWFIKRIEKFLNSKNRRLMGWDEILEGGLAPRAAVMSWRGMGGGIAAARQNHDVVMSPTSHCYFDYNQGPLAYEPLPTGGNIPLKRVYEFEPVPPELTAGEAKHILGAQANVWTEHIPNPSTAQYMTLPRMAALAEVCWSARDARSWPDFARRTVAMFHRYEALGYNYARSGYLVSYLPSYDSVNHAYLVKLDTELPAAGIRYTLSGRDPDTGSEVYTSPISVKSPTVIRAAAFSNGDILGRITEKEIRIHKGTFKPVKLKYQYERYTGGGPFALVDGIRGTLTFSDGTWQGFHGKDLDAVIDLGTETDITRITVGCLETTRSWIFLPTEIEISVSTDGEAYASIWKDSFPVPTVLRAPKIMTYGGDMSARARYVRVRAKNIGACPGWHPGKGDDAWLFVDEIMVE
jgi:hexosaminidase